MDKRRQGVREHDLARIFAWAEENEGCTTCDAKLATAYLSACVSCAHSDDFEDLVGSCWGTVNETAYMHRDTIGWIILLRMRKRPLAGAEFCGSCEACKSRRRHAEAGRHEERNAP